ncbi:hypothetical protein KR084_000130, partial [Drosophila pseudotakahashii]
QSIQATTVKAKLQLIGEKYYHIEENIMTTWKNAETHCIGMGGYLASVEELDELIIVSEKIDELYFTSSDTFWVGVKAKNGTNEFVSVASGKPSININGETKLYEPESCVWIAAFRLWQDNCDNQRYFICQFDHQV